MKHKKQTNKNISENLFYVFITILIKSVHRQWLIEGRLQSTMRLWISSNGIGESWGMANNGEWRTGQFLVEGVKAIKCFHPRMLTPLMARVNTN